MNSYNQVLEALQATNGVVINDHKQDNETIKLLGVAALVKGDSVIPVALCDSIHFSINRLYVDELGTHLSRDMVGDVVFLGGSVDDIQKAVEAYNEDQETNKWSTGKLEQVVYFS